MSPLRCSDEHLNKECRKLICFNCDQIGHESCDCPEDMLCCICKQSSHMAIDCPHSWYRRPQHINCGAPVVDDPTPQPQAADASGSPPVPQEDTPLLLLLLLLPLLPNRLMSLQLLPLLLTAFLTPKAF